MHYSDITDALDRKIEALLAHQSQHADPVARGELLRAWGAANAAAAGLPEGRFAEFVRVVVTL